MFKHSQSADKEAKPSSPEVKLNSVATVTPKVEPASLSSVQELLEKNLKWSQIIYEQNRKLNRKLIWTAMGTWLPFILIVVPMIIGIIYIQPMINKIISNYGSLFSATRSGVAASSSLKSALDLLPINAVERDQIKALLK